MKARGVAVRWLLAFLAVTCGVLLSDLSARAQGKSIENVIILVPRFSGESEVADTVTNLLRLQVSATFQEADTGTRGRMIFANEALGSSSHENAVQRGLELTALAHFVLWGNAYELADGVALQAFISTTPLLWQRRPSQAELPPGFWSVDLPVKGGERRTLVLGLPRTFYRMPPVLISDTAAREYVSLSGLPIFASRGFDLKIGETGKLFRALEYAAGAVRLNSDGTTGWVRLDFVNEEWSVIVSFAGALVRIARGDYGGAFVLLKDVLTTEELPHDVRVDTYLLLGLVEELQGRSGLSWFTQAVERAPRDHMTVRYMLLNRAQTSLKFEGQSRRRLLDQLREDIRRYSPLFSEESRWFTTLQTYAETAS